MILNFFKAKPTLKELIPNGFIDIHSHILPGIDDGAKDVNESLKLISEMKKLGFSKIIGTPHSYPGLYDNSRDSIHESFLKLKNQLDSNLEVSYASEYFVCNSIVDLANEKKLLTLKENYILIEMSFLYAPNNLFEIIFQLQLKGYKIIIAHPERYIYLSESFKSFHKLKDRGCYFQFNLLSATGYYGNDVLKLSNKLFKNNMIDYCGTDIHSYKHIEIINNSTIRLKYLDKLEKTMENNFFFR